MSWLGDFLGGKKAPAPPSALGANAAKGEPLADAGVKLWHMLEPSLQDFASVWEGEQNRVQQDALAARELAGERVGDYDELWQGEGGFLSLAQRTAAEAADAGSMARQAREQARAEKAAREGATSGLMRRRDAAFRRGIMLDDGGGVMEAVGGGIAAAAGTEARLRERDYGETVRRGLLPTSLNVGGMAPGYAGQRLGFSNTAANTRAEIPGGLTRVFAGGQGIIDGAFTGLDSSNALWVTKYDADLQKHSADQARKRGIWNTVTSLAETGAKVAAGGGG